MLISNVTDLVVQAGPISLPLQRSLDTRHTERGLLGTRWRLNWESRLTRLAELVVIDEGISTLMLVQQAGTQEYRSASGDRLMFESDGRAMRRRPDESAEVFDPEGRLLARANPNGNAVVLRYGPDGRLARIDGPRGSFIRFSTDPGARVLKVDTSSGHSVAYGYRGDQLASVQINGGPARQYSYDASGRLTRIQHPSEGSIDVAYDAKGRVLSRRFADGAGERYEYDDANNAVRQIDSTGAATTTRWSQDQRQAEITGPLGARSTIVHDAAGRLVSATGPTGKTARFTHDDSGRVAAMQDPLGQTNRFEYAGTSGRVQAVLRPDGVRQSYEYDVRGNLSVVKVGSEPVALFTYHPDGSVATVKGRGIPEQAYTYHPNGRLASQANAAGATTRFEYDARGNLIRETNPLGGTTLRSHDAQDRLISKTDPAGATTRYEREPDGRLKAVIDAAGQKTRYEYDRRGRLVAEVDPAGRTTRFQYDAAGRMTKRTGFAGSVESFRYDANGNLLESADRLGRTTRFTYDPLGRVVAQRRADGLELRYRYDGAGQVAGVEDSTGTKHEFQRDPSGRPIAIAGPGGATTGYGYDASGTIVASTSPGGHVTKFTHGADGHLARVDEPSGNTARYEYDPAGRLAAIHRPSGGTSRFSYDAMGNLAVATDPLGNASRYSWDAAGRLSTSTDAAGRAHKIIYDAFGRISEKQFAEGKRISYRYDRHGNLLEADDGAFPVRFAYDPAGRVARSEYPAVKKSLKYEYDARGLRTKLIYPDGKETRYEYNALKQLAAIILPDQKGRVALKYDAKARIASVVYPNGITGHIQYDSAGRTTRIAYQDRAGKTVSGKSYVYDAAGNAIETRDHENRTHQFKYDPSGQLTEERGSAESVRYRYAAGGNRAEVEQDKGVQRYRHDKADRLVEVNGEPRTYDGAGRLISRGSAARTVYEYDAEGRLAKVAAPDGAITTFGYAASGLRAWKKDAAGIAYYLYDGLDLVQELAENGAARATYVHGPGIDRPLAMLRESQPYFYHSDGLGSIALLSGGRGEIAAAYEYDAFGNLRRSNGSVPNPFTFTGREWDASTGLYYYRARYYDPRDGRFVSTDPIPGRLEAPLTLNPYVYVRNNPLRYVDPLGLADTLKDAFPPENTTWSDKPRLNPADPYWMLQHARWQKAHGGYGDEFGPDIPGLENDVRGQNGNAGRPPVRPGGGYRAPDAPAPATTMDGRITVDAPHPWARRPQPLVPGGVGQSSGFVPKPPQVTGRGLAGAGLVAGDVIAVGVDYQACIDEGIKLEDCRKQLGEGVATNVAIGVVTGILVGGASAAVAPVVAVGAAGLTLVQLAGAGNRWVNAPDTRQQAAHQAQLEDNFNNRYAQLFAAMEAKVKAFEGRSVQAKADHQLAKQNWTGAKQFADAAESNLAALRGMLSATAGAETICGNADAIRLQVESMAADIEKQGNLLEAGLGVAQGFIAACATKEDVTRAKDLYQEGKNLVAGMIVRARQAQSRNDALKQMQAAGQQAKAAVDQADGRVQMIAGNAAVAARNADAALAPAAAAAQEAAKLAGEKAALFGQIESFRTWFPPKPMIDSAIEGWKGRVSAAGPLPAEVSEGPNRAMAASGDKARAERARDEAQRLLADARSRTSKCAQIATADDAVSRAESACTIAQLAMHGFSALPGNADACLVKLVPPAGRTLVALHVDCPKKVAIGATVKCVARGVWSDNLWKGEDLTGSPGWNVGPTFVASTPGPVAVNLSYAGFSDTATVLVVEPAPAKTDKNVAGPTTPRDPTVPGGEGPDPSGPGDPPTSGGLGGGGQPIPPGYTSPTGAPLPPGTTTAQQGVVCWSDQLQRWYPVSSSVCPPTSTRPPGRPPTWDSLLPPRSPAQPGAGGDGMPPKPATGSTPATAGTQKPTTPVAGTQPPKPPAGGGGATCGPMTSCQCAGGGKGHIPCDKDKGPCHCGAG